MVGSVFAATDVVDCALPALAGVGDGGAREDPERPRAAAGDASDAFLACNHTRLGLARASNTHRNTPVAVLLWPLAVAFVFRLVLAECSLVFPKSTVKLAVALVTTCSVLCLCLLSFLSLFRSFPSCPSLFQC